MTTLLKVISYLGLALTVLPSFLVFTGQLPLGDHFTYMLIGTALWLTTAPFWINRPPPPTPVKP